MTETSNTNATRHKSRNGETHTPFFPMMDREDLIKGFKKVSEEAKRSDCYVEKGIKETDGKLDYSDIDLDILDLMANRYTANRHKYQKGNLFKPIEIDSLLWATFRHLKKMIQPIENDPETFEEHLAAGLCNLNAVYIQTKLKKQK